MKTWTRWNQLWWRCTGWPWGLIRYVWFKFQGVAICDLCWDQNGAANPAEYGTGDRYDPLTCDPCAEAAFDQAHR